MDVFGIITPDVKTPISQARDRGFGGPKFLEINDATPALRVC
jgi:hypothetical protein